MAHNPFNPLDRLQLANAVAQALLRRPLTSLPLTERFNGAGLYALYYIGDFEPFTRITDLTDTEGKIPIYVGKAVPKGGRTGNVQTGQIDAPSLFQRINKHASSISQASNLNIHYFRCRYLIVDSIWIPLGEQLVIQKFRPLWNRTVMQGFGINAPGKGRVGQRRSHWDTVHPGRSYAMDLPDNDRTAEEIIATLFDTDGGDLVSDDDPE